MIIEQCCATSAEGQADLVLSLRASPSLIRRDPILLLPSGVFESALELISQRGRGFARRWCHSGSRGFRVIAAQLPDGIVTLSTQSAHEAFDAIARFAYGKRGQEGSKKRLQNRSPHPTQQASIF
jgi:hypothetical protein